MIDSAIFNEKIIEIIQNPVNSIYDMIKLLLKAFFIKTFN